MAGSLYRTPSGAWLLRVYVGRDPQTGKKRWRARSCRGTKKEAARALAGFVTELEGAQANHGPGSVCELLEKWYAARSADWSPSTAQQTRWMIDKRLAGLHARNVVELGTEDLDSFYGALRQRGGRNGAPLSVASVARTHSVLRLALAQAVSWGWRPDNPAERADPGRHVATEVRPPAPEAVRALFEAAMETDAELLTFVALEAETGARRSELAALRFNDFRPRAVTIARTLVIGPDTEENRRLPGPCMARGMEPGEPPHVVDRKAEAKEPTFGAHHRPLVRVDGACWRLATTMYRSGHCLRCDVQGRWFPFRLRG